MIRSPHTSPTAAGTDGDLLAAVALGDRPALGELVRRYVDFVYAAAVRQLGDPHAAEDVTQAVFLVLAKKAGRVRGPALAAWLHQTTVYAAANARRAARRRRRHEFAAAKPEADMPAVPPDTAARELLARLDAAIAALPEKDRVAVCGRYLRGEELSAVAAALGTTPAAAQKRIERAVEVLRRRLASEGRSAAGVSGDLATSAAVLAALALTAPSPATAAPPALALAAATPAATSIAKGVIVMTLSTKLKVAAAAVLALLIGGAGAQVLRRAAVATTTAPVASTSPSTGTGRGAAAAADRPTGLTAKFPDGVTTELLAIGDAAADVWWTPDGRPTPRPEGVRRTPITPTAGHDPADRWLTFVTATHGPRGPLASRGRVVPQVNPTGRSSRPQDDLLLTATCVPADAETIDWHTDVAAEPLRTASLRPEADGRWGAADAVEVTSASGKTYRLSDAADRDGRAEVVQRPFVGAFETDSVTVTLFDAAGRALWAGQQPVDTPAGGLDLRTFAIEHRLADVAEARLTVQHYDRWAEFRGVSLRPDRAATPVVVTGHATPADTAPPSPNR